MSLRYTQRKTSQRTRRDRQGPLALPALDVRGGNFRFHNMEEIEEKRLAFCEKRLDDFSDLLVKRSEIRTLEDAAGLVDEARFMALYSIVLDLAQRAGVEKDDFTKHYQTRLHWWHDWKLKEREKLDPASSAQVDLRTLDEVPTSDYYSSIFDPPGEDQG